MLCRNERGRREEEIKKKKLRRGWREEGENRKESRGRKGERRKGGRRKDGG